MIVLIIVTILAAVLTIIAYIHTIETLFFTSLMALAVLGPVSVVLVPYYYSSSYSCSQKAKQLGYKCDYGLFKGCFMYDGKQWFEYSQQRFIRTDSEGK